MRAKWVRPVALSIVLVVGAACGGGGMEIPLLDWVAGVFTSQQVVKALRGGDEITVNYGGLDTGATVPHDSNPAVGDPIALMPRGVAVMKNAYLPAGATPVIRIVNLDTGLGGVTGVGLTESSNDLVLTNPIALPVGKWRMTFEGGYQFFSRTKAKALNVGTIQYDFDVYGPNGFSNIPQLMNGTLPKNGGTQQGLTINGKIPRNNGQGPASFTLESIGGVNATFTTTKSLGAQTWTWNTNDTIAVPDEGLTAIRVKVQF